jgi:aminoglycoside phosphotransferase family enzyme/predicted kinase
LPTATAGAQDDAIAFLADRATHGGAEVSRIETHGNLIFLAGTDAWKIKRAVRFPYMDFSTLERRHQACLAEIEINRRFAPELYIEVAAITRTHDGRLALGGDGTPVEWAVHMRRFGQDDLLSARAEAGSLTDALAKAVADRVCESHAQAPAVTETDGHGRVQRVLTPLIATLSQTGLDAGAVSAWAAAARAALESNRTLLDARARRGCVRHCHGDLHAANIVLWHGRPMLYDAIEFDPEIARIDTLYDLAFLLMDLGMRGAPRAANVILNRTLWKTPADDAFEGLALLPLFMSLRAAIRAMVTAERASQESGEARAHDLAKASALLSKAQTLLDRPAPRLIAVAGLSGTGKSTLASALAPHLGGAPGAVHIRTDLVRKALAGVDETQRLPPASYTPAASRTVYAETLRQAGRALDAGATVIVDAVAAHADERDAIAALAQAHGLRFDGLWLTGDADVLSARVAARDGDASDATVDVVRTQATWETGLLGPGWHSIDAAGTAQMTYTRAAQALGLPPDSQVP